MSTAMGGGGAGCAGTAFFAGFRPFAFFAGFCPFAFLGGGSVTSLSSVDARVRLPAVEDSAWLDPLASTMVVLPLACVGRLLLSLSGATAG